MDFEQMTTHEGRDTVYRIGRWGDFIKAPASYRGAAVRVTPRGMQWLATLREHTLWCYLPYGKWTCSDGREVLFNRHYEPMLGPCPESRRARPILKNGCLGLSKNGFGNVIVNRRGESAIRSMSALGFSATSQATTAVSFRSIA
jgi:hypothetical protein